MAETIKNKHLYAYKKALEEQNTFHTIFGYPLLSPIKYSFVAYAAVVLLIETIILYRLLKFLLVNRTSPLLLPECSDHSR